MQRLNAPRASIFGLTLHQPWAELIVRGPKRIENRDWPPPSSLVGSYLAIHAGKTLHLDAWKGAYATAQAARALPLLPRAEQIADAVRLGGTERQMNKRVKAIVEPAVRYGAVVGVARVERVVKAGDGHALTRDPWFVGTYGIVLADVVAIEPVTVDGAQGLWALKEETYLAVRAAWDEAVGPRR